MLNQKEISSLAKNDKIDHFFVVKRSELRKTKNNDEFLALEFADKNSTISGNLWKDKDGFEEFRKLFSEDKLLGKIINVQGTVGEFNSTLNIEIKSIRLKDEKDNVSLEDFIRTSERDINEMIDELKNWIARVSNKHLNKLLKKLFNEETLQKFAQHPAGKTWHHSYIGGLIEHTLEIINICSLMCKFHKELNRDLLIAGAMIHDLGKIEEISPEIGFEYTTKGKLLGHIVIAASMVEEAIKSIKDFPEDLKVNLLHLLLSHQGKLEQASPVVPKTLEAIVLYHADELSAKTNAYKLTLQKEQKSSNGWTKFINLANTDLYNHNLQNNINQEEIFIDNQTKG